MQAFIPSHRSVLPMVSAAPEASSSLARGTGGSLRASPVHQRGDTAMNDTNPVDGYIVEDAEVEEIILASEPE